MQLELLNDQGQATSTYDVPETVFGRAYNEDLVHQVVRLHLFMWLRAQPSPQHKTFQLQPVQGLLKMVQVFSQVLIQTIQAYLQALP